MPALNLGPADLILDERTLCIPTYSDPAILLVPADLNPSILWSQDFRELGHRPVCGRILFLMDHYASNPRSLKTRRNSRSTVSCSSSASSSRTTASSSGRTSCSAPVETYLLGDRLKSFRAISSAVTIAPSPC